MYYGSSPLSTRISTVVTPATAKSPGSPYDLATLAQVKAEPWYSAGANVSDVWLQRIITACSNTIADYCNRIFQVQTYKETIFLQRDPPIAVTIGGAAPLQLKYEALVAGSSAVTENGNALILGADYLEDHESSQLTRLGFNGYPMRWPKLELTAQYKAGFAPGSPDMAILADACIDFVKWRWMSAKRDPALKSENVVGVYEAAYLWGTGPGGPDDMPAGVAEKIRRYRVPVIA